MRGRLLSQCRCIAALALFALTAAVQGKEQILPSAYTGLWAGSVTVDAVSVVESEDAEATKPSAAPFRFPLLIHSDASGRSHLLKQVAMLWRESAGSQPGRHLLITDPDRLAELLGAQTDPWQGQRLSSAAFDYDGYQLEMAGVFGAEQTLSCLIELGPDLATNPFRHQYHPDHDDADEIYKVQRAIELQFAEVQAGSDGAITQLHGVYRERLKGLHHKDIFISGVFTLQKITATASLNR